MTRQMVRLDGAPAKRSMRMRTLAEYEHAMTYKGRVSLGVAERLTGIPRKTISHWWRGGRPKEAYTLAQKAGEYKPPKPRRVSEAYKRKRRSEADRRWYYRTKKKQFHPVWNPDPALAPLEHLWLPGAAVLDFIRSRYSDEQVRSTFTKNEVGAKRFYDLAAGRREWIRYDTTDAMFIRLGLVVSEMDAEPVYSTVMPTKRTERGEQAA